MRRALVVAPHADDETLGCGGTLLRLRREGWRVHWVLMTRMTRSAGFPAERVAARRRELERVRRVYSFSGLDELPFSAAALEDAPRGRVVEALKRVLDRVRPELLFSPGPFDAHSDHRAAFEAVQSCAKTFRTPFLTRILAYETLSETDAALPVPGRGFAANSFSDITATLDGKVAAFALYRGEGGQHPFPRSPESIRALAHLRGGQSGFKAAEAFQVLRERW